MRLFSIPRVLAVSAGAVIALGIVGLGAHSPARAHIVTFLVGPPAPTSTPLLVENNPGTGPGVQSQSAKGDGLVGQTLLKSTGPGNAASGVIGHDLSTKGTSNAGVRGDSTNGTGTIGVSKKGTGVAGSSTDGFGVLGQTLNPSLTTKVFASGVAGYDLSTDGGTLNWGLYGQSTNASAIGGYSTSTKFYTAIYGNGTSGTGMFGTSSMNDGVYATTGNPSLTSGFGASGVTGVDSSTDGGALNFGVFGLSTNGTGLFGQGRTSLVLYAQTSPQDIMQAYTKSGTLVAHLDAGGNLYLSGKIFTAGSCSSGCIQTRTSAGRDVTAFSERSASPSIEDFGQGRLSAGEAYVRIDPSFAQTMDQRVDYLVFITPEGDSRGLYVTGKTATGFTVRENGGGRSTLTFDYRIVAKPFDMAAQRLPAARSVGMGTRAPIRLAPMPRAPGKLPNP